MRLYFIFGTAFQSLLSKAAEYTAISFMVEIIKCYHSEDDADKRFLLLSLFVVSIFTFVLTILFPVIVFVSLIFKPPEDTFYPLTAHTVRLLMCADLRLLSRYVEKYAINYYGPLLWWNQPTFITLSWIKLIFEDLVELVIQILFILYIHEKNTGLVMMTAIGFTGSSIISSFITIYLKETSELDHVNLFWIKHFILYNTTRGNDETSNVSWSFQRSTSLSYVWNVDEGRRQSQTSYVTSGIDMTVNHHEYEESKDQPQHTNDQGMSTRRQITFEHENQSYCDENVYTAKGDHERNVSNNYSEM